MSHDRVREVPAERFDAPCLVFDLHQEARALRAEPTPARHGHRQKTLYKRHERTIALFVMDADARLQEHAAAGAVSIQTIEGEVAVTVDREERRLGPGQLMTLPPNAPHSVLARVPSAFLPHGSLGAKKPPQG